MQKVESNQIHELNDLEKEKMFQSMTNIFRVVRFGMRIFILVGMGVSIFGVILLWEAISSRAWPSVKGSIISASLEKKKVRSRVISHQRIQYVYHVKGKKFVGERVTLTPRFVALRLPIRQEIKKYTKGERVDVYYNPSHPEESVLEPGFNPYIILIAAVGPFVLFVTTILFRYTMQLESSARLKLQLPNEKAASPAAPIHSKTPDYETTRKWIMVFLTAFLLVLLAIQFYGDDIKKWYESIKREDSL